MRPTHSQRLETWLGAGTIQHLQLAMKGWYGPPIALAGVPGEVFVTRDGDFHGRITEGEHCHFFERVVDWRKRISRGIRIATGPERRLQLNAGFASLSDLIAEASAGKRYEWYFQKVGPTGVANVSSSLWRIGNRPAVGSAPSGAAGGTAFTDASTGALAFANPTGGDTQHFVAAEAMASVAGNTLLLYDLIYGCAKTMNSVANESVTGVPTRYQSSTATAADYAGGNFMFIQVGGTALAATAHDWGVAGGANECLYRNQAGTDNTVMPVLTGNASAIVDRLDHPTNQWFCPLAAGDTGVMDLAQMRCSATVATGVIWFMIGHPIAFLPCPIVNLMCAVDGINTAFNMARIFDDACLALLEVIKPSSTATTYNVSVRSVAG